MPLSTHLYNPSITFNSHFRFTFCECTLIGIQRSNFFAEFRHTAYIISRVHLGGRGRSPPPTWNLSPPLLEWARTRDPWTEWVGGGGGIDDDVSLNHGQQSHSNWRSNCMRVCLFLASPSNWYYQVISGVVSVSMELWLVPYLPLLLLYRCHEIVWRPCSWSFCLHTSPELGKGWN